LSAETLRPHGLPVPTREEMRPMLQSTLPRFRSLRATAFLIAMMALASGLWAAQGAPKLTASAAKQIAVLEGIKGAKTAAQNKIESRLFLAILKQRQDPRLGALPNFRFVTPGADGKLDVDIDVRTTGDVKAVMASVVAAGGTVRNFNYRYHGVRARLPITAIEGVAVTSGVRKVMLARNSFTHAINTSEGDVAHRAAEARAFFGVNGAACKICVLSDGVDSLA